MRVTPRFFEGLTFKLANEAERARALALRSEIYAQELGNAGIDSFDGRASHLVALDTAGGVIATLRVIHPESRPFDFERYVSLKAFDCDSNASAEISRFCIEKTHRHLHRGQLVHLGMLKLLYEFASRRGFSDLFTLVFRPLESLYRTGFFRPTNVVVNHPTWGETQLMHLNMNALQRDHRSSNHPIARLLLETPLPNIVL
jgi:N-acyl-L-homoserine lactone synthetase